MRQTAVALKYANMVRERGLGIVFITHNVRHAMAVGDRITVLNRGQTLGTAVPGEIVQDELLNLMASGRKLQDLADELGIPCNAPQGRQTAWHLASSGICQRAIPRSSSSPVGRHSNAAMVSWMDFQRRYLAMNRWNDMAVNP